MSGFAEVYQRLCEQYPDERDRGRAFEPLVTKVLRTDPLYQAHFAEVWPWNEWPGRDGGDIGIDIALEWLFDRYRVTTDKASGIVNDPNDWGVEIGEPRYIIDLVKRVTTVSVETMSIVRALPAFEFVGPEGKAFSQISRNDRTSLPW